MFDWENAIALHAMQGIRASSRGEGEVSWPRAFSRVSSGDSDILSSCDMSDEHA